MPQSVSRSRDGVLNWKTLVERVEAHLQFVFGKDLLANEWKSLPVLGPKQHFYAPNVKFIAAEESTPLNRQSVLNQLQREYHSFTALLENRKASFESTRQWDESESEFSTSSSDSDQEFEVDEIIDKEVDDEGIVRYLVTWRDYPGESTWVRKSNMENAVDLIEEYEAKINNDS